MPLLFLKPPAGSRQAFLAGLQHLVQLGRVPAGLHIHPHPQPIYVLNFKEGVGGAQLPAAQLVTWRYFAGPAAGPIVAGEVRATSPPVVTNLRYGAFAQKALQATLALPKHPEVHGDNLEVRVLRIPGALVEGIWLKPQSDSNGFIARYGPTFGDTPDRAEPLPIDDFLNTLRPVSPLRPSDKVPTPQQARSAAAAQSETRA